MPDDMWPEKIPSNRLDTLDQKLEDILFSLHYYRRIGMQAAARRKALVEIKQAFADNNYVQVAENPEELVRLAWGKQYMTGQEWLDRFRKEYRALSLSSYTKDRYAKMAAEKASRL